MKASEYVTVDEAGEMYRIHRVTVYDLVKRHGLTIYRRPGDRHSYLRRKELEQLFQFQPVRSTGDAMLNQMRANIGRVSPPKSKAKGTGKTN